MTRKSKKTNDLENTKQDSVGQNKQRNKLKPRTTNQNNYIQTINNNVITLCRGVAGSGKTHISVGVAIEYLLSNKVNKIVITRPIVESGERIGFLPGTAEEKIHPYLLPIIDEISHFIPISYYANLKLNNKIEVVPLALMRGRSFHNSFIIADECQNASYDQLKMLLTRIGFDSKMVITGDTKQSDLAKHAQGGFEEIISRLSSTENIGVCSLIGSDIVRNPIIAKIIDLLE